MDRAAVSLITVARFAWPADADLARGALEAAGIESYVTDDSAVRVDWLARRSLGGIKLRIRHEDWERAEEILRGIPEADLGERPGQPIEEMQISDVCEQCGSADIHKLPKWKFFIAACVLILGLDAAGGFADSGLLSFLGISAAAIAVAIIDPYRCRECGHSWRRPEIGP